MYLFVHLFSKYLLAADTNLGPRDISSDLKKQNKTLTYSTYCFEGEGMQKMAKFLFVSK